MGSDTARWVVRLFVIVGVIAVAAGCFLRGPTGGDGPPPLPPVTSSVEPTLICPGDPVTVTWDGGPVDACEEVDDTEWGSGCEGEQLPTAVTVASGAPDLFASDPVASTETRGTRTVNPAQSNSVTVGFTRAEGDLSYSQTVQIEVFDSDELQPAIFPRTCEGGGQWLQLQARPGQTLPARMVITEVCNPNPYRVVVDVVGTADPILLDSGECTGELRGTSQIRLDEPLDPQARLALLGGEDCRPMSGTSDSIAGQEMPMEVRLRCEED